MDSQHESRTAPFYHVPPRRLVSVEHPAVIRNLDKAVDTLQGNVGIHTVRLTAHPRNHSRFNHTDTAQILNPPKADTPVNLVLRPEDVMARPIQSISCASNNVLLKVTVPKRTGRKRKRGSNEPFTHAASEDIEGPPPQRTSKDLLRSLQDNASKYQIDAVGRVDRTHVFRGMFEALCQYCWFESKSPRPAGFHVVDYTQFLHEPISRVYHSI